MFNHIAKKILDISDTLDKQGFYKVADKLTDVSIRLALQEINSPIKGLATYRPASDWATTPLSARMRQGGPDLGPMLMTRDFGNLIYPAPTKVPTSTSSSEEWAIYNREMDRHRKSLAIVWNEWLNRYNPRVREELRKQRGLQPSTEGFIKFPDLVNNQNNLSTHQPPKSYDMAGLTLYQE